TDTPCCTTIPQGPYRPTSRRRIKPSCVACTGDKADFHVWMGARATLLSASRDSALALDWAIGTWSSPRLDTTQDWIQPRHVTACLGRSESPSVRKGLRLRRPMTYACRAQRIVCDVSPGAALS